MTIRYKLESYSVPKFAMQLGNVHGDTQTSIVDISICEMVRPRKKLQKSRFAHLEQHPQNLS